MKFIETIEIEATAETVWRVMSDLTAWPDWTPTINSIEVHGNKRPGPGITVKVQQPKLPPGVYKITSWIENDGFVMVKGNPLLRVSLIHELVPKHNRTRVELAVGFSGLFGPWVAKRYGSLIQQYLALEAAGLKRQSEALLQLVQTNEPKETLPTE